MFRGLICGRESYRELMGLVTWGLVIRKLMARGLLTRRQLMSQGRRPSLRELNLCGLRGARVRGLVRRSGGTIITRRHVLCSSSWVGLVPVFQIYDGGYRLFSNSMSLRVWDLDLGIFSSLWTLIFEAAHLYSRLGAAFPRVIVLVLVMVTFVGIS